MRTVEQELANLIADQVCQRCTRWVGHFDWCPNLYKGWCICQTSAAPAHKYGDSAGCLYVADWQDPARAWRGIVWTAKQLQNVEPCHWPHPVEPTIVLRASNCEHGTGPWDYAT